MVSSLIHSLLYIKPQDDRYFHAVSIVLLFLDPKRVCVHKDIEYQVNKLGVQNDFLHNLLTCHYCYQMIFVRLLQL